MIESKDETVIKAELPGIDEKHVDIEIESGVLTIKGERNAEKETEEKGFWRRTLLRLVPSLVHAAAVEPEKVSATFTNGLLEVHLPKKEEARPRSIEVDVNGELSVELFPKQLPKTNPVMLRYDEHPRCVKNREESANRAIHRL